MHFHLGRVARRISDAHIVRPRTGLGSVSEILEGDAPHLPRGCVAQAWGVAEVLRVWRMLDGTA